MQAKPELGASLSLAMNKKMAEKIAAGSVPHAEMSHQAGLPALRHCRGLPSEGKPTAVTARRKSARRHLCGPPLASA